MVELDNVPYTIKTPSENTTDMVNRINDYCSNNNITNSKGEQVYVEQNMASPLYLLLWAMGYMVAVFQNLVYGLGKAFNVQAASEKQLLNLANMAGMRRGKPSLTTFNVVVTAASGEDVDTQVNEGKCVITTEDTITYDGVEYYPAVYPNLTLEAGHTGYLTFIAKTTGSFNISAGSIVGFDNVVANLGSFSQRAAIPGREQESIASLRERLQRRQYSGTSVDMCMDAIEALEGVTSCAIYINENYNLPVPVGEDGISVPPRSALCIVQGYNANIAQTFYENLSCPSVTKADVGGVYERRVLEVQHYVSHASQEIPLIILKPAQDMITINVHIAQSVEGSIESAMKAKVCELAGSIRIGQTITASMVLDILKDDFSSYGLIGVQLSGGKTQNLSMRAVPYNDAVFTFNLDNITIVMPEADE